MLVFFILKTVESLTEIYIKLTSFKYCKAILGAGLVIPIK